MATARSKPTPPLSLRRLKADMVLKHLSLSAVARSAKINPSVASDILNGRRNDPQRLSKLRSVISLAKMPEEVHA